ncbi:dTDP-glucose 4,6-dehydratase [compost metagenome]
MSNLLVTGATGLIGSHLLERVADRHSVWAIAREIPTDPGSVTWIPHDLSEPRLPDALPDGIDTVIHLAQSPHFRDFPASAPHVYEVNLGSTSRLLDWAYRTGVKRFIYASSGGVYGFGAQPFHEHDSLPVASLGHYTSTKRASELLVESYASCFPVAVLRFFFVYGRGQKPDMLIPRLVRNVREGNPISLQGPDGLQINPLHVSDAAQAIEACLGLEGSETLNVGGPEVLSLRRIAEIIGTKVGRPPLFQVDEAASPRDLIGAIDRMRERLGAPRVNFAEGVADLCRSE